MDKVKQVRFEKVSGEWELTCSSLVSWPPKKPRKYRDDFTKEDFAGWLKEAADYSMYETLTKAYIKGESYETSTRSIIQNHTICI